jgi:signal peptidase I
LFLIAASCFGASPEDADDRTWFVTIEGGSMRPTLRDGQTIEVERNNQLNRFGIVEYAPRGQLQRKLIGRIIGVPGELVGIESGFVKVNYKRLNDVVDVEISYSMSAVRLEDDTFFILGDNRNDSYDSHVFGAVLRRDIFGVVVPKD